SRRRHTRSTRDWSSDVCSSDLASDDVLTPGPRRLAYEYTKSTGLAGHGELRVDGRVVGAADIRLFTPMQFSNTGGGMTCGYELRSEERRVGTARYCAVAEATCR